MNICIYGASSNHIDKVYLDSSFSLSQKLANRGHTLVFGGGDNGVMGECARGALSQNGKIIGIAPTFFNIDGVLFEKCTEFIPTETMRERKRILEERSDAFIIAPGGIGTFDEFFEILTLKQLARHNKPIAIFNVNGYYDGLIKVLEDMAEQNFMKQKSLELFGVFSDSDKLLDYIENYNTEDTYDIGHFKSLD